MIASGGVWGLRLVVVTLFLSIGEATTGNWEWRRMYVYENRETSPGGDKIGTLSNAKFKDNKAKYMYRISGEGANTIFTVNDYGDIFVNVKLDREKKSVYNLNARLVERENTDKDVEAPSDFAIHVQDINDEAPVFHGPFKGSIQEMSPIGTTVMTVNATDNDDPTTVHAMIEFKLLNGTDVFNIDKKGIITTKVANLDREATSEYRIIVLAKDQPGQSIGHEVNQAITISLTDINDNLSTFKTGQYTFSVKEDAQVGFEIGRVEVDDKDEEQNKRPVFKIGDADISHFFEIKQDPHKNGVFSLRQPLDYESKSIFKFKLLVIENLVTFPGLQGSPKTAETSIIIKVLDVDEPPRFDRKEYNITVDENKIPGFLGSVSAKDPDTINHPIRYSIEDSSCPVKIDEVTGQLSLRWELDRELAPVHRCQVTAVEQTQDGMKGYAMLNLWVRDVNDNAPKLHTEDIYVCESDGPGTVVGILTATDKDETNGRFTFMLDKRSSNFSLSDNNNGTATLRVKEGGFSTEDSGEHVVNVKVNDGKHDSIESLHIRVCTCDRDRIREYCRPGRRQVGVSMQALITILLCIVTILVIVILLVLRRRYQKESVALGKMSGEIHEQLVTYDEEGGGEMDTNGYDVSILTSARHDASLLPGPGLYAMVNKPQACKGDMAAMIEVKKDEADHDRDGYPYDTLHIYGYEGPGSLAGSLSSLGSSSSGDSLDYDFLNEWGPRFRTLAELYGVDCYPGDCPY